MKSMLAHSRQRVDLSRRSLGGFHRSPGVMSIIEFSEVGTGILSVWRGCCMTFISDKVGA